LVTDPTNLDGELASPDDAPASPELERRAFVRRMTNDSVGLAGRLFGASKILTRASVAAGQAVRDEFESMTVEGDAPATSPASMDPAEPVEPEPMPNLAPATAVWAPPIPVPSPPPGAEPVQLTARQAELLAGAASATIAVNGDKGSPLLGIVPIHWDGETVRIASLGWSRRATAIRADPHVSLLIDDPASGDSLWIEGLATIVIGDALREAMAPFLPGDMGAADAEWAVLLAQDFDRIVISIRPTKALPGRARR
jgi:hypothetical protein